MMNFIAIIGVVIVTPLARSDHCDLNNDECFRFADKSNWTFNYVTTKQEYIELISQGKSGLTNRYTEKPGIIRRNGFHVGHVEKVELQNGVTVDVITKAMRPLLFEIPDFLSPEECAHIIERAKDPSSSYEGGMFKSIAKGGLTPLDTYKPTGKKGKASSFFGKFLAWDRNEDMVICIEEMIEFIHWRKAITMLERDVHEMFIKVEMDELMKDGVIDEAEFEHLDTIGIEEYVDTLSREHPRFKHRHSTQTFLLMEQWIDGSMYNIRERLSRITGLSRDIIYGGERLQVVHYPPHGHYHAHMDTETDQAVGVPCCHQKYSNESTTVGECRICRFVTFMMYLNDVEEGGETAFPIADGEPMDKIEELEMHSIIRGSSSTDKYDLSHGCQRANIVVRPEKGKAVLWYNHLVNETNGWLGQMDVHSLHGGCDVKRGEKWIANMWIPAPYENSKGLPSEYINWFDLEMAEEQARRQYF